MNWRILWIVRTCGWQVFLLTSVRCSFITNCLVNRRIGWIIFFTTRGGIPLEESLSYVLWCMLISDCLMNWRILWIVRTCGWRVFLLTSVRCSLITNCLVNRRIGWIIFFSTRGGIPLEESLSYVLWCMLISDRLMNWRILWIVRTRSWRVFLLTSVRCSLITNCLVNRRIGWILFFSTWGEILPED